MTVEATAESTAAQPSEASRDLVAALGGLVEPTKSGKAVVRSQKGEYSYTYLELPDLLRTVRTAFAPHHLAVMQQVTTVENGVEVVTTILHGSGHTWSSPALYLRCAPDPQSIGGASTYGRRYSLAAMVGLAGAEDGDAESIRQPRQAGGQSTGSRATTVQVVKREQQAPPEPDRTGLVSDAQMRRIGALIGEWEQVEGRKLDRDERRRLIGFMAGVADPDSLSSAKDLTREQASAAIDALTSEIEAAEPQNDVVDAEVVGED